MEDAPSNQLAGDVSVDFSYLDEVVVPDPEGDPLAEMDPWLEFGFTDAELEEWLGASLPNGGGSDDDPWTGVERVTPRPLTGVTGVAGPALAPVLSGLDMSRLSPAQLVEAMTGAERLSRWAQGVQLAAVKAFADYAVITDEDACDDPLPGRQVVETGFGTQRDIERFCSDGIGAALGTSFTAAQQLIDAAYFASDVPKAAAMLAAGLIDVARLKVLARELAPVGYGTPEDQELVDSLVERSAELTPKKLQVDARTAVMASRPDGQEEAHRREKRSRGVWVHRKQSGMATLSAYLTAEEAQAAYQALNAQAWRLHDAACQSGEDCVDDEGAPRRFDTFRADALVGLLAKLQKDLLSRSGGDDSGADVNPAQPASDSSTGFASSSEPDTASDGLSARARRFTDPARVMLHLYMQASTLAGLDQRPATLLGYGSIGAEQARRLAEDAALTRILTDPFTGEIKAIDLPSYRVPKVLKAAVQARDRTCVFPGCDVPAFDAQLDHIDPHPFARRLKVALATGRTSFVNLHSLCLRHHYLKTHGGWIIQDTPGSRLEFISPTGHSYRRNPEWGPPLGFWRDHDPTVPIDQPKPPPEPDPPDAGVCPF